MADPDEQAAPGPTHIRVVNNLKERIFGRYDGEDFEFLPGASVRLPILAAIHIFGFGQQDKTRALNNLGWLRQSEDREKAMAKLNRITFTEAPPLIEAEVEPEEDEPAGELTPPHSALPPPSPEASGGGAPGTRPGAPKPR